MAPSNIYKILYEVLSLSEKMLKWPLLLTWIKFIPNMNK